MRIFRQFAAIMPPGGFGRQALALFCCLWALLAPGGEVTVIHGRTAVPAGEQRFAESLARHVVRWYREVGLDVRAGDDTDMATRLRGARVAVLVYMSQPTAAQMAELRAFVGGGGRLIVCYSASTALADLMGVRVTGYRRADPPGRWSMMRFAAERPRGVPAEIAQSSPNLMMAEPVAGRSSVLAWWQDREGRLNEAAWLVSGNGYWMTHVLLADGDAEAKGRLLLALAASADTAIWSQAAQRLLPQARAAGMYSTPAALGGAAAALGDPAQRSRAQAAARAAGEWEQRANAHLQKGAGMAAWEAVRMVQARMREAYGLLQTPRRGEIRAVWDHSGMGLYPGDWPRTCTMLKAAGITDLMVNVGGAAFAHYASAVLPQSKIMVEQGDQLKACLAAARPLGIRVHAWILCFSTERATPERLESFGRQGWLLTSEAGKALPWLDPSSVEARAYLVRAVREIASRYNPDGVHLDFVRYPDFASSLGAAARPRFERHLKRNVRAWPQDVKWGGSERAAYLRWRAAQVELFVADARLAMRAQAPGRLLTAAVFGKYPSCVDAVGQDWEAWLRNSLIDYAMPMNYTEDAAVFRQFLADQTRGKTQARKIIPGLGVTAAESRLNVIQTIDQINALRAAGCPGFALFDLSTTLQQEVLPILRLGITE